jgi:phosphatidylglycerophosphate synthase
MKSSPPGGEPAPGRPDEIESASNRLLVHPLSRAVAGTLAATPVTPNQVSMASVAAAAGAAASFLWLAPPWGALAALGFLFVWHVLDGADGELARRTGRASGLGELVDGVCDHASQVLVYVALALVLQRGMGPGAWWIAVAAGVCHFVQAGAYESGRKTYRRWVYGSAWMRQTLAAEAGAGLLRRAVGGLYIAVSSLGLPGEAHIEAVLEPVIATGGAPAAGARALYRETFAPLVKASGVLSSNARSLAAVAAMLIGQPAWFFLFEIIVQSLALAGLLWDRRRRNAVLLAGLTAQAREQAPQAASAPNWRRARRA